MERSRRTTNPDNYEPDFEAKRGNRIVTTSEYPRLEPVLVEAWEAYQQAARQVSASERKMSDSS